MLSFHKKEITKKLEPIYKKSFIFLFCLLSSTLCFAGQGGIVNIVNNTITIGY
jgi:hypothetical protein